MISISIEFVLSNFLVSPCPYRRSRRQRDGMLREIRRLSPVAVYVRRAPASAGARSVNSSPSVVRGIGQGFPHLRIPNLPRGVCKCASAASYTVPISYTIWHFVNSRKTPESSRAPVNDNTNMGNLYNATTRKEWGKSRSMSNAISRDQRESIVIFKISLFNHISCVKNFKIASFIAKNLRKRCRTYESRII